MAARRQPSVRARQLAGELRRLREASTPALTGAAAAARLGWPPSKISRIETARISVSAEDLRRLLDLYRVTGPQRKRLTALGRTTGQRGWWDAYKATTEGYSALIALESDAESERQFAPIIVPGLLQTAEYALAITRASVLESTPPAEITRLSQVRMNRQKVLTKDKPLKLDVVLDESVLRRQVGEPEVMRGQLAHLVEMAARPNIMLRVLPLTAGPHLALTGVFTIVRLPEKFAFEIVFVENMTSDLFIEDENDVHRYSLAFGRLLELALEEDKSIALISQIADGDR